MSNSADPTYYYRHSGLLVRSAIELPEWEAFAQGDPAQDPDIVIAFGDALARTPEQLPSGDRKGIHFSVAEVGRWSIARGESIVIEPIVGAPEAELRLFTLGSAWGAAGYQRGLAMLHGSSVRTGGKTLLFCGAQEAGKSTIAAALVERDGLLVADDLSRVDPPAADGGSARIWPSSSRMKLWDEAIDHLGWRGRVVQRDHFRTQKYHLAIDAPVSVEPLPLDAIILLGWGEGLSLHRLAGGEAVREVLQASCYRPEMLDLMGRTAEQATMVSRIVAATPVYRLVRPRDFTRLDEVCRLIEGL